MIRDHFTSLVDAVANPGKWVFDGFEIRFRCDGCGNWSTVSYNTFGKKNCCPDSDYRPMKSKNKLGYEMAKRVERLQAHCYTFRSSILSIECARALFKNLHV